MMGCKSGGGASVEGAEVVGRTMFILPKRRAFNSECDRNRSRCSAEKTRSQTGSVRPLVVLGRLSPSIYEGMGG